MNLWVDLMHNLLGGLWGALTWLVGLLPAANLGPFQAAAVGLGQGFGWAMVVNTWLPMSDLLAGVALIGAVYIGLHSGNLVRRIWSLISGGGGA